MTERLAESAETQSYQVCLCRRCKQSFVTTQSRKTTTLTCSQCGVTHARNRVRTVGTHPEREGAAELRTRWMMRQSGDKKRSRQERDCATAEIAEYWSLDQQIADRGGADPLVSPPDEHPATPEYFQTAAHTRDGWETAYQEAAEKAFERFEQAFRIPAESASVDGPADQQLTEAVTQRVEAFTSACETEPPVHGQLSLTQTHKFASDVSISVQDDLPAPTELHQQLFGPRGVLTAQVLQALNQLWAQYEPASGMLRQKLLETGVTAVDGVYHRLCAATVQGHGTATRAFLEMTEKMGSAGGPPLISQATLSDVKRGPAAVLAVAAETDGIDWELPVLQVEIGAQFVTEYETTRRQRLLEYLHQLVPGVTVQIVSSQLGLRKLMRHHEGDLPASVTAETQQRLCGGSKGSPTEQATQTAEAALDRFPPASEIWKTMSTIASGEGEAESYQILHAASNISQAGVRQRLARLRDAGLIESSEGKTGSQASLTAAGAIAMERYQKSTLGNWQSSPADLHTAHETDSRQSHPDRCQHSPQKTGTTEVSREATDTDTGHEQEPEVGCDRECGEKSAVTHPRKSRSSTVVGQNRHKRGGGTASTPMRGCTHSSKEGSKEDTESNKRSDTDTEKINGTHSDSEVDTEFLALADHHSTVAAVGDNQFGLIDRSLSEDAVGRDHRQGRFSYDPKREEIVVSVDFSPTIALTAVRLCAALLSDQAFDQILTIERLAGTESGARRGARADPETESEQEPETGSREGLGGLPIQSPAILRRAVCLGWLPPESEGKLYAGKFCHRLQEARNEVLHLTRELSGDEVKPETLSELLKQAHGLMGVAIRLYDLLGIDVVREIQFPSGAPTDQETQDHLCEFLMRATAISSCKGVFSAYRVLYEEEPDKREDILSQPAVSLAEPMGAMLGPWVLTGAGVERLRGALKGAPERLELQQDGEKFARFQLQGAIVDGNRRSAVAETAVRVLSFTDGIRPDRQAISVLAALAGDVKTAGEALGRLGGEDSPRPLDMQDLRWGLSQVPAERLVPDCGGAVVSDVIGVLLDAQEQLSTAEVADRAERSRRSLTTEKNAKQFAQLEAMGLLSREDRGTGRATLWRLQLSFRKERRGEDRVVPRMIAGAETTPSGGEWHCTNALLEVMTTAAEGGHTYPVDFSGEIVLEATAGPPPQERNLGPLLDRCPAVHPVVQMIATLLAQETRLPTRSGHVVMGLEPEPEQERLT